MKKRRKMVDWINNAFRWRPSLIFYVIHPSISHILLELYLSSKQKCLTLTPLSSLFASLRLLFFPLSFVFSWAGPH